MSGTFKASSSATARDGAERIGILLVNSGTPNAPTARAVRRFLARFLGDPRVIDLPRLLWLPLLYGLILPFRPRRVARKYQLIWSSAGSPLRDLSVRLRNELAAVLAQHSLAPLSLELGMLYSEPDMADALRRLRESGAQRLLVLPLFPQYSGATGGAVLDQLGRHLRQWPPLPDVHIVADYHDHPGYIDALRGSVTEHWQAHGRTAHLFISFHGIPERYVRQGDPYVERCHGTARLLADELLLREGEWSVGFQSRFGAAQWVKPYTQEVLAAMPARGVRSVSVLCPGFAVDCLETLEEIEVENRAVFMRSGGERYDYISALNARPAHAQCLADLIAMRCRGWTDSLRERLPGAARGASA